MVAQSTVSTQRSPATKLTIEYDGREFKGWAKQPGHRTIQEELERALAVIRREPTKLTVAGRTDAGVHALAQIASYAGEPVSLRSINALLPPDVAVTSIEAAPPDFDARADAKARTYRYRIWNDRSRPALDRGRVWWQEATLDRELLDRCAETLLGEHDFQAFTLSDQLYSDYRRRVLAAEWRSGTVDADLEFWISGNTFTRRMVRALVSFQIDVARGSREYDRFVELLNGAPRKEGGATAPPDGLYLARVDF